MSANYGMPLFDQDRMARHDDPPSSRAAADHVVESGAAGRQAEDAVALVRQYPGRTSAELAELSNLDRFHSLDRYQLARRLPELYRAGLVSRETLPNKQIHWFPKESDP